MQAEINIGTGIYTVTEAARILNISSQKLGQWVRKYWELEFIKDFPKGEAVYTVGEGSERVFNFYTLIEMITVAKFRAMNISFNRIKEAHRIAAEVLETPYPFAMEGFMADGRKIFHNKDLIASLLLDKTRQLEFRRLIEPYCKKIDFEETTKLAERFWPLGKNRDVLVDPNHRFGEPVIKGTNISTSMIYNLHIAGEPVSFIAEEYNIPENAVQDVIEFHQRAA